MPIFRRREGDGHSGLPRVEAPALSPATALCSRIMRIRRSRGDLHRVTRPLTVLPQPLCDAKCHSNYGTSIFVVPIPPYAAIKSR